MLDSIEPEQFREWMADYLINPWDGAVIQEQNSLADSLGTFKQMAGA